MKKIESIETLRFPLALFVVMEHTFLQYNMADGNQSMLYIFFDAFLRGNSVPVFFFISGYLFFYGCADFNMKIWMRKLESRIHTLLIPYILWNVFAILILWITMSTGMERYMADAKTFSPTTVNILKCFWMYDGMLAGSHIPSVYPINVAMWYVRDLIILSFATPVIYRIVKKNSLITFGLCITVWAVTYNSSLFFFTAGAYFSINGRNISFKNNGIMPFCICTYILSSIIILSSTFNENIIYIIKQINIIVFLPLAFAVSDKIKKNNITIILSSASSLIYFAHQPICGKINKLIIAFIHPEKTATEFAVNIFAVMTTVTVLSILYLFLNKHHPKTLYILTGK